MSTANEINESELDRESKIEDDEDNFELTQNPPVISPPKTAFEVI